MSSQVSLASSRSDFDLEPFVAAMYVRRAYVWGRFKEPKSKASKAPVPMHPLLAGFLLAWREKTPYARDNDFVFPSTRLKGKKPLSASILVQKYLRPAAVKAGICLLYTSPSPRDGLLSRMPSSA